MFSINQKLFMQNAVVQSNQTVSLHIPMLVCVCGVCKNIFLIQGLFVGEWDGRY